MSESNEPINLREILKSIKPEEVRQLRDELDCDLKSAQRELEKRAVLGYIRDARHFWELKDAVAYLVVRLL